MSVTILAMFIRETERAICIRPVDRVDNIWLPKSQIKYDTEASEGEVIDVEVSDWIAEEKGLG